MTGDVRVVEDGAVLRSPERPPGGPSWVWLVVGLAVGLGLAVVFSLASSGQPEEVETPVSFLELEQPEDGDPETSASEPDTPEGVGEVVDGFPDTLLAVTQLPGGNLGLLTWPVSGPPMTTPLPGFTTAEVEFDQSGRMVATGTPVADSEGFLLSFGTPPRMQPLATGVTGFVWHESDAGAMAYTQVVDGEWRLMVVDRFRDAQLVTRGVGIDGVVVAYGSWGFAIQGDQEVTLLDETGEIGSLLDGRLLDADADGRVVIYHQGLSISDAGGSPRELEGDIDLVGELEVALISPDGAKLAVVGGAGHMIIPLEGDGEVTHAPVTSGFPQMVWSSDSRYLVSPWIRGVLFIDTERSFQPIAELTRHTVVAVTTVPLGQG